jgi:hypothetical protein
MTQEMLTPSFLATSRALTSCLIGRSSTAAPTAVPYKSTPLTRGITWSFEPTLGMILIYGMDGVGGKSHREKADRKRLGMKCSSPGAEYTDSSTQAYFESLCAGAFLPPVICASSAATATRRLSGIVFA